MNTQTAPPTPRRAPGKNAPLRPLSWKTRVLAALLNGLVQAVCATLRLKVVNEALIRDSDSQKRGFINVTWHGRIFIPQYLYRGRRYWTIISLSRDGDLTAENFRRAGFRIIRGSTSRRGFSAAREVLAVLAAGEPLVFVPDGPRGPSGKVQNGVVYFAQRSGLPIIPSGTSAWPRWLLPTWDRFLIPSPFARAIWIFGDPIYVGPDDDLDEAAARVETAIHSLEAEAERHVLPASRTKKQ